MVPVHVRHHHPSHIARIVSEAPQLCAHLFLRRDPPPLASLHEWVPPRLIARIVRVRAFPRVDHRESFWMLDQPAVNWQLLGPFATCQHVPRACQPRVISRSLMVTLDLNPAGLDACDLHAQCYPANFSASMPDAAGTPRRHT